MKRVRKGKLVTMGLIRQYLAQAAGASCACPLTTGIFARLAAEAAEEDRSKGKRRITPYWRTIRDDGKLNEKFPGGAAAQAALLEDEGFSITPGSGKQPPRVAEFAKHLMRL
ncbi:MAG: MGMT family protein [Phycisphaerales bacterium]|nr:MGMT family protein [Phycisphaerales bacterium]